jgi:hypothetical protein
MSEVINAFLAGQQYRNQLNQQQQQAQAMQEQRGMQNTAGKVQSALMQGDREGARSMAMASGNANVMTGFRDQIGAMDERERTRQRELFGAVGNLANSLRSVPVEQRSVALQSEVPRLMQMGVPAEEIQRYDQLLSDPASSDAVLAALSSRVLDAQEVFNAHAPQMQAENEVMGSYQGGVYTQGAPNPNAAANRAVDQQNANARTMAAQTAAQREQRQASQPQGAEWRTLTADEAASQGFNSGDVVQVNSRTGQMARRSQDRPERMFNQQQSLAAEFANRMIAADQAIDRVSGEGFQGNEMTRGDIPMVGGVLRGSRERRYDQAVDDFITAVLRRESGAAISAAEFETAYRQYFPSLGDDPATIEQKRALRQRQIQNMQASSQGAFEAMFGDVRAQPQGAELGEGATATNPETGQRVIFRNGQWEPIQ